MARSWTVPLRPGPVQGLELEADAHLVQVAHQHDVGHDRQVAAVGRPPDQALGVQPHQGFADRGAGDADQGGEAFLTEADVEGELAEEEAALQFGVGAVAAQPPCLHASLYTRRST